MASRRPKGRRRRIEPTRSLARQAKASAQSAADHALAVELEGYAGLWVGIKNDHVVAAHKDPGGLLALLDELGARDAVLHRVAEPGTFYVLPARSMAMA